MKQKEFIMHMNDYFEIIRNQKSTTSVTMKIDIFKGGIGRVKVTQEHELKDYLDKNGKKNNHDTT